MIHFSCNNQLYLTKVARQHKYIFATPELSDKEQKNTCAVKQPLYTETMKLELITFARKM